MTGEAFRSMMLTFLEGFGVSLELFGITLLVSIPLGFVIALGRISKYKIISWPLSVYISIMRGTPLLLQLLFFSFGPFYMFGWNWNRFLAVCISFSLNYAAYFAEIFRGGIASMPIGQYEASAALGFGRGQTFFRVILPQVIKRVLPASANEIITLVKDTSLVQAVGVVELFSLANKLMGKQVSPIPLIVAGAFYYIFNLLISFIFRFIEKKLNYYK